jgi:3-hydroxyisobutyrate dehydrogenase-like beta-hydroxyacid dehydrogenase
LLAKDTRLALETAQAVGFEGALGGKASQVFAKAVQAGLADLDDAALLGFLQRP